MSKMINGLEFVDVASALENAYKDRPIKLDRNQLNTIMTALRKMYDEPAEPKVEIVYTDEWGQDQHYAVAPTSVEHGPCGDIVKYDINQKFSTLDRRFREGLR